MTPPARTSTAFRLCAALRDADQRCAGALVDLLAEVLKA